MEENGNGKENRISRCMSYSNWYNGGLTQYHSRSRTWYYRY